MTKSETSLTKDLSNIEELEKLPFGTPCIHYT